MPTVIIKKPKYFIWLREALTEMGDYFFKKKKKAIIQFTEDLPSNRKTPTHTQQEEKKSEAKFEKRASQIKVAHSRISKWALLRYQVRNYLIKKLYDSTDDVILKAKCEAWSKEGNLAQQRAKIVRKSLAEAVVEYKAYQKESNAANFAVLTQKVLASCDKSKKFTLVKKGNIQVIDLIIQKNIEKYVIERIVGDWIVCYRQIVDYECYKNADPIDQEERNNILHELIEIVLSYNECNSQNISLDDARRTIKNYIIERAQWENANPKKRFNKAYVDENTEFYQILARAESKKIAIQHSGMHTPRQLERNTTVLAEVPSLPGEVLPKTDSPPVSARAMRRSSVNPAEHKVGEGLLAVPKLVELETKEHDVRSRLSRSIQEDDFPHISKIVIWKMVKSPFVIVDIVVGDSCQFVARQFCRGSNKIFGKYLGVGVNLVCMGLTLMPVKLLTLSLAKILRTKPIEDFFVEVDPEKNKLFSDDTPKIEEMPQRVSSIQPSAGSKFSIQFRDSPHNGPIASTPVTIMRQLSDNSPPPTPLSPPVPRMSSPIESEDLASLEDDDSLDNDAPLCPPEAKHQKYPSVFQLKAINIIAAEYATATATVSVNGFSNT